ncbi:YqeB family protein [Streptomyces coeruleorubidus]|uniref:YqeB family protein n=1 Tax=Streptomyces coeruleorubidus TaxID=116188 RepID=UPI0036807A8A
MEDARNVQMGKKRVPQAGAGKDTELAESAWVIILFCVACGAGIGAVLPFLARLLLKLPWAPLEGPAELLTSVPEPALTLGTVAVGALGGLLLGLFAVHESLSVRVSDTHLALTIRDSTQEFTREETAVLCRDGKQLVVLAPDGMELAREHSGLPWQRLADTLAEYGYRWAEEDPYRAEFHRWVPGTPGLPEGADALLRARAKALKSDDDAKDARELRRELLRLGVVVRDEEKRQYWRPARQN